MHSDDIPVETPLLHLALGVFNVHTLFVKFVSGAGFDSTLLLDFVMSPETNFSHFLFKYLEIVNWEKENAVVFNYDLQSACAELDIVDEYMSMDLSGSEDAEDENVGGENSELDLVENSTVQVGSKLPNASIQEIFIDSTRGQAKFTPDDDHTVTCSGILIDSSLAKNTPRTDVESGLGSDKSIPTTSRKRESCNLDEPPCAKRASLSALSDLSIPDLELAQTFTPDHPVPVIPIEESAAYKPSENVSFKELSQLKKDPKIVSSENEELPPTATFVKVLSCLVELGDTLSRLCKKELLSKKVNNVEQLVCLTERLKCVFPNVLCA